MRRIIIPTNAVVHKGLHTFARVEILVQTSPDGYVITGNEVQFDGIELPHKT